MSHILITFCSNAFAGTRNKSFSEMVIEILDPIFLGILDAATVTLLYFTMRGVLALI